MARYNVRIELCYPVELVMLRHQGRYEELPLKFDELFAWVEVHKVPVQRTIGIFYDNPEYVPTSQLRSAACVEIPAGYAHPPFGSLPLERGSIKGGEYASMRYVGPYEDLGQVWADFTSQIENDLRRVVSQEPAYEVYLNDAMDTAPRDLITELYMPIA